MTESERNDWETTTLSYLGEFRNGVNYSRKDEGEGLKLIKTEHIFTDGPLLNLDSLPMANLEDKPGIENCLVEAGDIFFVRSYGRRDGVGFVSMAPSDDPHTVHGGFIIRFRVTSAKADSLYLTYLLRSPHYRDVITASSGGSTINNVNQETLGSLVIKLPPFDAQRRIVGALFSYDSLIENGHRRIQLLEKMIKAIHREWFVHLRFPGHEKVEMVDSELGSIPEGWTIGQLGDIAEEVRRNTTPSDLPPDTPYVGLAEIPRRSIALHEWGKASDAGSNKLQFKKDEILFGKIRPYFHKVVVAPIDGICSGDTIVIVPKTSDMLALTLSVVNSDYFVAHATASSKGTKMPRADWDVLVNYPIVIPESSVLKKFNLFIENSLDLIQTLIFLNRSLQKARDLLLPRLISGEIDASNLIIDVSS